LQTSLVVVHALQPALLIGTKMQPSHVIDFGYWRPRMLGHESGKQSDRGRHLPGNNWQPLHTCPCITKSAAALDSHCMHAMLIPMGSIPHIDSKASPVPWHWDGPITTATTMKKGLHWVVICLLWAASHHWLAQRSWLVQLGSNNVKLWCSSWVKKSIPFVILVLWIKRNCRSQTHHLSQHIALSNSRVKPFFGFTFDT